MADRISPKDEDITIHELGESFNHTFAYLKIYANGSHNLTEIRKLKEQIINDIKKVPELEVDMKQLMEFNDEATNFATKLEIEIEKLKEKLEKIETRCTNLNDEDELVLATDIKEIIVDKS